MSFTRNTRGNPHPPTEYVRSPSGKYRRYTPRRNVFSTLDADYEVSTSNRQPNQWNTKDMRWSRWAPTQQARLLLKNPHTRTFSPRLYRRRLNMYGYTKLNQSMLSPALLDLTNEASLLTPTFSLTQSRSGGYDNISNTFERDLLKHPHG